MSGLNLARAEERIEAPLVVTEARPGVSDGQLARLVPSARGVRFQRIESLDEQAALEPGGRWLRHGVGELTDGVYRASSVGRSGEPTTTYFTIASGEVRRIFGDDRKRAEREVRRRSGTSRGPP